LRNATKLSSSLNLAQVWRLQDCKRNSPFEGVDSGFKATPRHFHNDLDYSIQR
jgi:hypothetical protein